MHTYKVKQHLPMQWLILAGVENGMGQVWGEYCISDILQVNF
jgi:hypothetical protein